MSDKALVIDPQLDLQAKTSRMLGTGIAVSLIVPVGFIAFLIGITCRKIINGSPVPIRGRVAVWWCIIVGAINISISIYLIWGSFIKMRT